jgi:hypothetical protein
MRSARKLQSVNRQMPSGVARTEERRGSARRGLRGAESPLGRVGSTETPDRLGMNERYEWASSEDPRSARRERINGRRFSPAAAADFCARTRTRRMRHPRG